MSKILLIETSPNGLDTIKPYLSEVNADYSEFYSVNDAILSRESPALVILLANQDLENSKKDLNTIKTSPSLAKIPRILILPFGMDKKNAPAIISGEFSFTIPVVKLRFLSEVNKFLKRSPRRVFRILINVQPDGTNVKYLGTSMDFSETGMSFECISDFPVGHKIIVSFVNPRNRKRSRLKAEIVRRATTHAGGTTFYGVMFIEMSDKEIKDLISFITGGN
jgi:hypothetical protein